MFIVEVDRIRINNSQMDLQRAFRAPRSPDDNCCKMIAS